MTSIPTCFSFSIVIWQYFSDRTSTTLQKRLNNCHHRHYKNDGLWWNKKYPRGPNNFYITCFSVVIMNMQNLRFDFFFQVWFSSLIVISSLRCLAACGVLTACGSKSFSGKMSLAFHIHVSMITLPTWCAQTAFFPRFSHFGPSSRKDESLPL